MARYVVTAVELNAAGRIVTVEGAETDAEGNALEPPTEVPAEQIAFALERGDVVDALFSPENTPVAFRLKPGAAHQIELDPEVPGHTVRDLPRIARAKAPP